MNNYIDVIRAGLNEQASRALAKIIKDNPEKVYWTPDELMEKLRGVGFRSKRDMAISLKTLGIRQRNTSIKGKGARFYELKYSSKLL